MSIDESSILRSELRWAAVVAVIVTVILGAILFAALSMHINPPSNREFVDPKTLHLSAEFTESNLGTRVDPDGQIVARIIATQFEFVPDCVVLTPRKLAEIAWWLPATCAYRLRHEGRPLYKWHHLVSGDRETVHSAGASVRGWTVSEVTVSEEDWEDYIIEDLS